jgi:hypothetical protein
MGLRLCMLPTQAGHLTDETDRRNAVIHDCSFDWFTWTASRCINSSGDVTRCAVPSRQQVLNFSNISMAALVCPRSMAGVKRATWRRLATDPS